METKDAGYAIRQKSARTGDLRVVAIGGGMLLPREATPFHVEHAIALSVRTRTALPCHPSR